MLYLALGAGLLVLLLWSSKARPVLKRPEWRIVAGMFAIAAFAAAAYVSSRGAWGAGIVLVVLGLWLAASTRYPRISRPKAEPAREISLDEAYATLDLQPGATADEVQAAYVRLMKLVHPDRGGGAGLAARLNAARDRLLKR